MTSVISLVFFHIDHYAFWLRRKREKALIDHERYHWATGHKAGFNKSVNLLIWIKKCFSNVL